jgi:hypothetical protein
VSYVSPDYPAAHQPDRAGHGAIPFVLNWWLGCWGGEAGSVERDRKRAWALAGAAGDFGTDGNDDRQPTAARRSQRGVTTA